ncbi:hypothetical protein AAG594_07765 [Citromicrobium bathyomarinum]
MDDYAAKVFLREKALYRDRRNANDLAVIEGGWKPSTFRFIENTDTARLRRFGLSLLWRFAVSTRDVAKQVHLPPKHLLAIRQIVLGETDVDHRRYPVYFSVASDGPELVKVAPIRVGGHPFRRFFLDGVVCYASPFIKHPKFEPFEFMFAGQDKILPVYCFDSSNSDHLDYQENLAARILRKQGNPF